jgi:hypothetical protein
VSTIRATSPTTGQSGLASLRRDYTYGGDKPFVKPDPAETLPQNARAIRGRKERLAEYGRLRTAEKLSPEEAAKRVGAFGRTTRRTYENEFQEQQRRESPS